MCRPNGSIMNFSSAQPERYLWPYIRTPGQNVAPDLVMGMARIGADAPLFMYRDVERGAIAAAGHQAILDLALVAQRVHQKIAGDHDQPGDHQADHRPAPAAAAVIVVPVVRHAPHTAEAGRPRQGVRWPFPLA